MRLVSWLAVLFVLACKDEAHVPAIPPPEKPILAPVIADPPDEDPCLRRVSDLEDRVARIELMIAEMEQTGASDARLVRYEPNRTTLAARTVQDAVDELAGEIRALAHGQENLGPPGPAFFDPDRDHGGVLPPGQSAPGTGKKGGNLPGGPPPGQPPKATGGPSGKK